MNASKFLLLIFGGIFAISCGNCCDDPCKDYSLGFVRLFINFSEAGYPLRDPNGPCASIPIANGNLNAGPGQDSRTPGRLDPDKYVLFVQVKSTCTTFPFDVAQNVNANLLQFDDEYTVSILLNTGSNFGSEVTIPAPVGSSVITVSYSEPCNSCDLDPTNSAIRCTRVRQFYSARTEAKVPKNTSSGNALAISMPLKYKDSFCNPFCK